MSGKRLFIDPRIGNDEGPPPVDFLESELFVPPERRNSMLAVPMVVIVDYLLTSRSKKATPSLCFSMKKDKSRSTVGTYFLGPRLSLTGFSFSAWRSLTPFSPCIMLTSSFAISAGVSFLHFSDLCMDTVFLSLL